MNCHILVVDDEPTNLLILNDVLSDAYNVHTTMNSQQALDMLCADTQPVDLILLDVVMPGLNRASRRGSAGRPERHPCRLLRPRRGALQTRLLA